ncbi:50S ribosomal protein L6 [Candidatus Woesearchaeota archaeon]|nr:50S ribosomal protein L6 [Candidatus Woesearchaeota archaeon]
MMSTFAAHMKNSIKGTQEQYEYKLKICSGHFPMNISVSGREFVIKNFLGETVPRKITLLQGADVKINGTEIVVKSADKEIAGQTAASIEQLCRITNRDIRIFQDGCYITQKAGEPVA